MPPTSLLQRLTDASSTVKSELGELLKHSAILDPGRPDPNFIVLGARFEWKVLHDDGVQVQQRLRASVKSLERVFNLLKPALSDDEGGMALSALKRLNETVMQERQEYDDSAASIFEETSNGVARCCDIVSRRIQGSKAETAFIVDTNALVAARQFTALAAQLGDGTVILVPPVLKELDSLKMRERPPTLKDAAESLIRQIGDLRRRGSLLTGVTIQGKTTARAVAAEPDFSTLPPELDPLVADDRFIGHALAFMASNPCAAVAVVTRDINLLNKCEFFSVPLVELP